MTRIITITVKESAEELKQLYRQSAVHVRSRIKMLQWILKSVATTQELSAKVGVSRNKIVAWKDRYAAGGIAALLADGRGGDFRSGISAQDKEKIRSRLSDPKAAFRSFGEAQLWINRELGMDKKYHAVNKYLKRNFGAKLKVGRKSHVKKAEGAEALFKKRYPGN